MNTNTRSAPDAPPLTPAAPYVPRNRRERRAVAAIEIRHARAVVKSRQKAEAKLQHQAKQALEHVNPFTAPDQVAAIEAQVKQVEERLDAEAAALLSRGPVIHGLPGRGSP
jgi:small-conductance mechanosensitive channel